MEAAGEEPGGAEATSAGKRKRRHSLLTPLSAAATAAAVPDEQFAEIKRRNVGLDVALALQSKSTTVPRKIDLAFEFMNLKVNCRDASIYSAQYSRLISFVGNCIQHILVVYDGSNNISEFSDPALDYRSWAALKISVESASVAILPNLLRAFTRILKHAVVRPSNDNEASILFQHSFECATSITSANSRAFYNAGIELWISCAVEAIGIVRKVLGSDVILTDSVLFKLSIFLLEQLGSFLRFYPNPKSIFQTYVSRLLDPLLGLLVLLHSHANGKRSEAATALLKVIEDALSNGLFHPTHISGYYSLKNPSATLEESGLKGVKGSYHRHLFQRIRMLKSENKAVVFAGFGYLFRLLVNRRSISESKSLSERADTGKKGESSGAVKDARPLFDVFTLFMEPLMLECKVYTQMGLKDLNSMRLVEAHCMIKSVNETFKCFIDEKIYSRTDDTSEGSNVNFLQDVYDTIIAMVAEVYRNWLSSLNVDCSDIKKLLYLLAREAIVTVGYLLEIEHKVIGDDLVTLWLMLFALLSVNSSSGELESCSSLNSEIVNLACSIIFIFSELRQVSYSLFTLCKAARIVGVTPGTSAIWNTFPISFSSGTSCLGSLATLLGSNKFQHAVFISFKSMPEGQVNGCLKELRLDLLDTLIWLKDNNLASDSDKSHHGQSSLQSQIMGRSLAKLYTTVVGSVTVTPSNSFLVGKSIENIIETIRPILTLLVSDDTIDTRKLFLSVTGKYSTDIERIADGKAMKTHCADLLWVLVFFFRLYASCRSLFCQSISLAPPDKARELSQSTGDMFLVYCGTKWMDPDNIIYGGYFSWIVKPSRSLLDVIRYTQEVHLMATSSGFASLVCALYDMVLQRLSNLKRQIKAFGFLHKDMENSCMLEAVELTAFVTRFSWSHISEQKCYINNDMIDVCSLYPGADLIHLNRLGENVLQVEIWQRLCENIDLWCSYASTKDLKKFISLVIEHCMMHERSCVSVREDLMSVTSHTLTLHRISLDIFSDASFHNNVVLSKYIGTMFCRSLKRFLLHVEIARTGDANLIAVPDLPEVLAKLDKEWNIDKVDLFPHVSMTQVDVDDDKFRDCENLLNLLCKMPCVHIKAKSCLQCATYLLHLEWILLSNLLESHHELSADDHIKNLRLLLACRRTFRYILSSFHEQYASDSSRETFFKIFGSGSAVLWLLKSSCELVSMTSVLFGECSDQIKNIAVPFVDHSSYIFLILGNICFIKCSIGNAEVSSTYLDVDSVAKLLESQASQLFDTVSSSKQNIDSVTWNKILCSTSCLQGFLWGSISTLDGTKNSSSDKKACGLESYVGAYEGFVNCCLHMLLLGSEEENNALNAVHIPSDVKSNGGSSEDKIHLSDLYNVNMPLLEHLLTGGKTITVFTLRELSSAAAAILKLKSMFSFPSNCSIYKDEGFQFLSENLLACTSYLVLQKTAEMLYWPDTSSFIWIEGVLKPLEVMGCYLSAGGRKLSEETFSQLVNAMLRALGKCILMQGKAATLSLHDNGSLAKMFNFEQEYVSRGREDTQSRDRYLALFKSSLQKVLTNFIRGTNLSISIQIIERALIGADPNSHVPHDVSISATGGGKISSIVAAGIDCLYLVLETFPGRNLLKKRISGFVSSLLNIVLHLQSPSIFHSKEMAHGYMELYPDSGTIILMCVEVLTKIAGRRSLRLDGCHVSQCLHVPVALFKNFDSAIDDQTSNHSLSVGSFNGCRGSEQYTIDHKYLVNIYAACCKLLCAILRRISNNDQVSDIEGCAHELQNSSSILLGCFEYANHKVPQTNGNFAWDLKEATACARIFRRIYEEIREQKEIMGKHSSNFLATYISIHSCSGPLQVGIRREIDEALRPGVYSLIDTCSQADFQRLHTYFGEGPSRSTLASLRRDYELYYQYKGKS